MRVWLVRHAASTTPAGITVGAGDPPLSEVGRAGARRAARAWAADITDTPASFAESVSNLEARVRQFWKRTALAGEAAVVAHRGSLAALQSVITGRPFAECFRLPSAWVAAPETRRRAGRNASPWPRRRAT